MKKIFLLCLIIIMSLTLFGCKNNDKDPLNVIDFETGTLNIDTSDIEEYIRKNGYENYVFVFDVDKSIYSCEIYLTENESQNVNIDGEGYEGFVAKARTFLSKGTETMADVMNGYGLSGISAGMVLASSEGVVYCVAIDGTISYIAHIKSDALTVNDLKKNIEKIANDILNDKLTVSVYTQQKFISIFYEGEANGGSRQTQESVQNAFVAVKDYLQEMGLQAYSVSINSHDGMPFVRDDAQSDSSAETNDETPVVMPETLSVKYLNTSNTGYDIFEIIASPTTAESMAIDAANELRNKLSHESFSVYVVDDSLTLLGRYTSGNYEPYEFRESYDPFKTPPYLHPFSYGLYKYFNSVETIAFQHEDDIIEGGGRKYTFNIQVNEKSDRTICQQAAEKLVQLMAHNVGYDKQIVITVQLGKSNTVYAQSENCN